MSQEKLEQSLDELKKILLEAQAPQQNLLTELMEKVVVLLSDEPDTANTDGLLQQLDEQAVDFEADHPKAAGVLRQIMDTLNKMGV